MLLISILEIITLLNVLAFKKNKNNDKINKFDSNNNSIKLAKKLRKSED